MARRSNICVARESADETVSRLRRDSLVIDAAETVSTAPDSAAAVAVDPAALARQLSESADVFWLPRRAGRVGRGITYRRFETLAEAVKFAVESISNAADIRIYTERGPIAHNDIPALYRASTPAPLQ